MGDPGEPHRPAENWKYPYVAGVVDYGSNLTVAVQKDASRKVDYAIIVTLGISSTNRAALGFLDEFCEEHGLDPNRKQNKNSLRLEISKRDDLQKFLKLVRPYVIARHAETEVLVKHLLPGLDAGKASSKSGFVELMGYVDHIREETVTRGGPKYDQDHIREEWGL